jgi:hypothetical protein
MVAAKIEDRRLLRPIFEEREVDRRRVKRLGVLVVEPLSPHYLHTVTDAQFKGAVEVWEDKIII